MGGVICGQGDDFSLSAEFSPYLPREARPKIVVIDALQYEYMPGDDGTFEADGEVWGTLHAFSKMWAVDYVQLHNQIPSWVRKRRAYTSYGLSAWFYALSDVRKACIKLLDTPQQGGVR